MPSGFQQDTNQLQPTFFRVVMTMSDTDIYTNNTDNSNGRVNPYNWDALTDLSIALPTTEAAGAKLARGNIRWQRVVEEVTKYCDAQILDLEVTGMTNGDTAPSGIAFTVRFDRFGLDADGVDGDSPLLLAEQQYLKSITGNTSSPYDNQNINNTTEVLQEMIMRAVVSNVNRSQRTYVPSNVTSGEGYQQWITAADATDGAADCTYADLRDTITVTGPIDGTTTINA